MMQISFYITELSPSVLLAMSALLASMLDAMLAGCRFKSSLLILRPGDLCSLGFCFAHEFCLKRQPFEYNIRGLADII